MTRVLVVEDSPTQARALAYQLEDAGYSVDTASDGLDALEHIVEALESDEPIPCDVIITDLQMPRMNGLELVEAVRRHCPELPVILITAHGSEEIAVEALKKGASSYVPKRMVAKEIVGALNDVLATAPSKRQKQRLLDCMTELESRFVMTNDPQLVTTFINYFCDNLRQMRLWDETGNIRFSVALREALNNAIYHGNLGVSSELRERDDQLYRALVEKRRLEKPFCDRRIFVHSRITPREAVCIIRDEGTGFDVATVPDPTDPKNVDRASGRGLMLIQMFMDEVCFSPAGNEITLAKFVGDQAGNQG